jgi:hypothetical protein
MKANYQGNNTSGRILLHHLFYSFRLIQSDSMPKIAVKPSSLGIYEILKKRKKVSWMLLSG